MATCTKTLTPVDEPDTPVAGVCRDAFPHEVAVLVELDRICFGRRAWAARAWWEVINLPEWCTAVLKIGEEVIAASVLLPSRPVASLASLAVHPRHRRQGHGRRMLRDAVERAGRGGACWLSLEVDRANPAAVGLYRQEGFGPLRRFREEGRWRLEMVRRLGGSRGE